MGKRRVLARYTKRSLRNTKLLLVSVQALSMTGLTVMSVGMFLSAPASTSKH